MNALIWPVLGWVGLFKIDRARYSKKISESKPVFETNMTFKIILSIKCLHCWLIQCTEASSGTITVYLILDVHRIHMLVTFPKAFSQVATFHGYFPKAATFQMCNFLTIKKLPLGKLHIWEVALGKMPLGKYQIPKDPHKDKVNTY